MCRITNWVTANLGARNKHLPVNVRWVVALALISVVVAGLASCGKLSNSAVTASDLSVLNPPLDSGVVATNMSQVPDGLFLHHGFLYESDYANNIIWKINLFNGTEVRIAGNSIAGHLGNNGPAVDGELNHPLGVAVGSNGNIYIADANNNEVRVISSKNNRISILAGTGQPGFSGDGGPANKAELYYPSGLAISGDTLYICDTFNNRIRAINLRTKIISTVAGGGSAQVPSGASLLGAGGGSVQGLSRNASISALSTHLSFPQGVAVSSLGIMYISDTDSSTVLEVNLHTDTISSFAGNGLAGYSGDGGPAIDARLNFPTQLSLSSSQSTLLIADSTNNLIRTVNLATGIIKTVNTIGATTSTPSAFSDPSAAVQDRNGNIFVADTYNNRVAEILKSGVVRVIAGNGAYRYAPSEPSELSSPSSVVLAPNGMAYIADTGNNLVKSLSPSGTFTTVAGNAVSGFTGDGGPAIDASLSDPTSVAVGRNGNLYIADSGNQRIREVDLRTGVISTVAGNGATGFTGDGGPAIDASLSDPTSVAVGPQGNLYIVDRYNNRIRKVSLATGDISTVVGNGTAGFTGNGGPALSASLGFPYGITLDSKGNIYVADTDNQRIRVVERSTQRIYTLAGNGNIGFNQTWNSTTIPPLKADFFSPTSVAITNNHRLLIVDGGNCLIRSLKLNGSLVGGPIQHWSRRIKTLALSSTSTQRDPGMTLPISPLLFPINNLSPPNTIGIPPLSTPQPSNSNETRVLLLGDSLAYTLGEGLVEATASSGLNGVGLNPFNINIFNGSIVGCGISVGGPFRVSGNQQPQPLECNNWPLTWAQNVSNFSPQVCAILIGRWELVDRVENGKWSHIGEYSYDRQLQKELLQAVMISSGIPISQIPTSLTGQFSRLSKPLINSSNGYFDFASSDLSRILGPIKVILLTMPYLGPDPNPTSNSMFVETSPMRVDLMNSLEYKLASYFPGKVFVLNLNAIFDPGGHYTLTNDNQTIRWPDGVHVTQGAGLWLAPLLYSSISQLVSPNS